MGIDLLVTNRRFNKKLNFGLNIRVNDSVMCANFGDSWSRDRKLGPKKIGKNGDIY